MQVVWTGTTLQYGEERTNYPLVLSVDDLGEAVGLTAQVSAPDRSATYLCLDAAGVGRVG